MKEYSFNSKAFLGARENTSRIYAHPSKGLLYSPFSLVIREVERLVVVNFTGDPKYNAVELQIVSDGFGEGAVVLLYHHNGKVDIYFANISNLFKEMYILGSGWTIVGETEIEYKFRIMEKGIDAYLKIADRFNQVIEFRVKENSDNKKLENILAPLGAELDKPAFFPFTYLKKFAPVNYEGTEITIVIDGTKRKPIVIPIKINGERKYLTRYSADPLIGLWNKTFRGKLAPIELELLENSKSTFGGVKYTFVENDGHCEISVIACESDKHNIFFHFSPPIPDLVCLKGNSSIDGRFAGGVDENSGVMGGEYKIQRDVDKIRMTVDPTKGWQPPVPGPLWLRTYRWLANMKIGQDEVTMESCWIRKKRILHDLVRRIRKKP